MEIRRAIPGESDELTLIALGAKAHWGYSQEQLAQWRDDLCISPESIASQPTFVACEGGRVIGVVQVGCRGTPWAVDHLWVRPESIGRGVGSALLDRAVAFATEGGQLVLSIDSDPSAEGFYLKRGARRIGAVAAPIAGNADRVRPQLVLHIGLAAERTGPAAL